MWHRVCLLQWHLGKWLDIYHNYREWEGGTKAHSKEPKGYFATGICLHLRTNCRCAQYLVKYFYRQRAQDQCKHKSIYRIAHPSSHNYPKIKEFIQWNNSQFNWNEITRSDLKQMYLCHVYRELPSSIWAEIAEWMGQLLSKEALHSKITNKAKLRPNE